MTPTCEQLRALDVSERIVRSFAERRFPVMLKGSMLHADAWTDPVPRKAVSDGPDYIALEPCSVQLTANRPDGIEDVVEELGLKPLLEDFVEIVREEYAEYDVPRPASLIDAFPERDVYADHDFATIRFPLKAGAQVFNLDIAVNFKSVFPPVETEYRPRRGEPFVLPYAASTESQVAGKLHQTLMRARIKDLIDLIKIAPVCDWRDPRNLTLLFQSVLYETRCSHKCDAMLACLVRILDGDPGVTEDVFALTIRKKFYRRAGRHIAFFEEWNRPAPATPEEIDLLEEALFGTFVRVMKNSIGNAPGSRELLREIVRESADPRYFERPLAEAEAEKSRMIAKNKRAD